LKIDDNPKARRSKDPGNAKKKARKRKGEKK